MAGTTHEFGTGWRFVAGAFLGIAGGFASLYFYTAGLFLKPVAHEFGWSRGEASLGSIAILVGNVIALPIAGRLVDRFGEVRVALLSSIALGISFFLLGALTCNLATYLALILLLTMSSAGTNAVAYNRVIVRHFVTQRGLALGIALTGTGVGAALVPAYLAPYIAEAGWRAGYYVLGAISLPLSFLAALMLLERKRSLPHEPAPAASWSSIWRHPAFATIGGLIFLSSSAVLGTTMHVVSMLTDGGMTVALAGAIASILGISVIFGRVFTGYLLDRLDAGAVTAVLLLLSAAGMVMLWSATPILVVPGAILVGLGVGTEGDLLAYLLGRRFPVSSFGSVYGAIFAVHAFGGGLGGFLAGLFFDWSGSYAIWLAFAAAQLIGAAAIALLTERNIHRTLQA